MKKATGFYPSVRVDSAPVAAVGSAGGVLLTKTTELTGLSAAMREALSARRKPTAVHDPGKVLTDVAVALALGGDCLADAAIIRAEAGIYGRVASEATVSAGSGTYGGRVASSTVEQPQSCNADRPTTRVRRITRPSPSAAGRTPAPARSP